MKTDAKDRGVATVTVDAYVWRRVGGREYVSLIVMKDDDTRRQHVSVKAEEVKVGIHALCDLERFGHRVGCVMRSDQDIALAGL